MAVEVVVLVHNAGPGSRPPAPRDTHAPRVADVTHATTMCSRSKASSHVAEADIARASIEIQKHLRKLSRRHERTSTDILVFSQNLTSCCNRPTSSHMPFHADATPLRIWSEPLASHALAPRSLSDHASTSHPIAPSSLAHAHAHPCHTQLNIRRVHGTHAPPPAWQPHVRCASSRHHAAATLSAPGSHLQSRRYTRVLTVQTIHGARDRIPRKRVARPITSSHIAALNASVPTSSRTQFANAPSKRTHSDVTSRPSS